MAKSSKSSKWFMTAIVGLMVIAMGGFGLTDLVSGSRSNAAVSVGDTDIDINEYNRNYQSALNNISSQQQRQVSGSEARMLGVPGQVTNLMVQVASISETARRAGISIPDSKIASEIAGIRAFQDAEGKLDSARFNSYLLTNQVSEKDFVTTIRKDITRNLVMQNLVQLTPSLKSLKSELNKNFGEARSAAFIAYGFEETGAVAIEPSDEQLLAYYDENIADYLGDPVREVQLAYLTPEPTDVSETELKTIYDDNVARYTTPAIIPEYYMLSFSSLEEAQKITDLDALKALAAERSLSEEDFLFKNEAVRNLPSELSTAILEGGAGFYGPIEGPLGYSVYSVAEIIPEKVQSFDEVKDFIAEGIAYDAMNEKLNEEQNTILDLIAGGVSPEEIAKESSLNYAFITTGTDTIKDVTDSNIFAEELDIAEIDEERDMISLENGGVAIIRVISESEATALSFESVREQVAVDLVADDKANTLQEFHDTLLAKIEDGATIEDIATEHNLTVTVTNALPRQSAISEMPLPIAFELFNKDIGTVWDITDQDKNYLIRADKAVPFDENDPANAEFILQTSSQIDAQIADQMINNFTANIASELNATINPQLIEQVVGVAEQ